MDNITIFVLSWLGGATVGFVAAKIWEYFNGDDKNK